MPKGLPMTALVTLLELLGAVLIVAAVAMLTTWAWGLLAAGVATIGFAIMLDVGEVTE